MNQSFGMQKIVQNEVILFNNENKSNTWKFSGKTIQGFVLNIRFLKKNNKLFHWRI